MSSRYLEIETATLAYSKREGKFFQQQSQLNSQKFHVHSSSFCDEIVGRLCPVLPEIPEILCARRQELKERRADPATVFDGVAYFALQGGSGERAPEGLQRDREKPKSEQKRLGKPNPIEPPPVTPKKTDTRGESPNIHRWQKRS